MLSTIKTKRATIKDVAQAANVSIATVSRILNGQSGVSDELVDQVQDAVRKLNYRPNAAARALKVQKSRSIGLIIPDIENPFFPALVRGVEDAAQVHGYALTLCNTDGKAEEEKRYIKFLLNKQVDGILFVGNSRCFVDDDPELLAGDVPIVLLDRRIEGVPFSTVMIDNSAGAYMAAEHLLQQGRRRIAMVGGRADSPTNLERVEGYRQALQAYGVSYQPALVTNNEFTFEGGYIGAEFLLSSGEAFDAVFAANDMMAVGVIECLLKHGRRVPEDVAVIGFDDIRMASWYKPSLTTIHQPVYEMGRMAVEMLLSHMQKPALTAQNVMLQPELIVRQSSGRKGQSL